MRDKAAGPAGQDDGPQGNGLVLPVPAVELLLMRVTEGLIMRILISNDDGIYSPGIAALARVAARFGDVRIVAPDVEQSSMGHAITHSRPLSYRRTPIEGFEAFRVNGTPADCVALGAHHWDRVDVVLSGINLGTNLGNAMWHSGTLAAAKQAVLCPEGPARNVSTETLSVSEQACRKIETALQKFKSEVRAIVHGDERKAEKVYQLNIQFFPQSR
jgi:5'/3'-nucleotidase SurE